MKSILKCKDVDWESAYVSGEMDVIQTASAAVSAGKNVVLLIDMAMLDNLPKKGKIGYPDHWVVMKSPIVETTGGDEGGKIKFSVWTWGKIKSLELDKRVFIKTFYGAAICAL